ncbi:hypothetical protein SRHO_G00255980 [Serrasalmus rhombeus]
MTVKNKRLCSLSAWRPVPRHGERTLHSRLSMQLAGVQMSSLNTQIQLGEHMQM